MFIVSYSVEKLQYYNDVALLLNLKLHKLFQNTIMIQVLQILDPDQAQTACKSYQQTTKLLSAKDLTYVGRVDKKVWQICHLKSGHR